MEVEETDSGGVGRGKVLWPRSSAASHSCRTAQQGACICLQAWSLNPKSVIRHCSSSTASRTTVRVCRAGFGFASFGDAAEGAKALREMDGKYIGNRPCKLRKSSWQVRTGAQKKRKL